MGRQIVPVIKWMLVAAVLSTLLVLIIADFAEQFQQGHAVRYYLQHPDIAAWIVVAASTIAVAVGALHHWGSFPDDVFVTALWATTNVLLTFVGGWHAFLTIRMVGLDATQAGHLVARNSGSESLTAWMGCIAVVFLLGTCLSWALLIQRITAGRRQQKPSDKPEE